MHEMLGVHAEDEASTRQRDGLHHADEGPDHPLRRFEATAPRNADDVYTLSSSSRQMIMLQLARRPLTTAGSVLRDYDETPRRDLMHMHMANDPMFIGMDPYPSEEMGMQMIAWGDVGAEISASMCWYMLIAMTIVIVFCLAIAMCLVAASIFDTRQAILFMVPFVCFLGFSSFWPLVGREMISLLFKSRSPVEAE